MSNGDPTYLAPSLKASEIDSQFPMPFFALDYGNATKVSVSGTTAASGALSAGAYMLVSDVDVHLNESAGGSAATTSHGLLAAGQMMPHFIDTANNQISGITGGASGSLYIIPVRTA